MKNKSAQLTSRTVRISGRSVRLYESNPQAKDVVLFLHGFMSDATSMQEYIEQTGADKHVIAPDLPGFGESERPSNVSLGGYAAWVNELCDELKVKPVVVVGYSFGAYIAVQYILQQKSKAKLLLLCPVVHIRWQVRLYGKGFRLIALRNAAFAEKLYRMQHDMTTLYVRRHKHPAVRKELLQRRRDELDYLQSDVVLQLFTEFLRFDLLTYAKQITNSTIIITAARDNLASNAATKKFAAMLCSKHVTHIDVRHAGHLLPIEEPYILALATASYINE